MFGGNVVGGLPPNFVFCDLIAHHKFVERRAASMFTRFNDERAAFCDFRPFVFDRRLIKARRAPIPMDIVSVVKSSDAQLSVVYTHDYSLKLLDSYADSRKPVQQAPSLENLRQ